MNISLSSESIFLSLAVTSLIGLWLIWQAVKINPGIDIWKISVKWLSDRRKLLDGNRDYTDSDIFINMKKPVGLKESEKIFKSYGMLAELENLQ
ncbi:hypothetical protein FJR38_25425 [Anabaena sp. UHCC 0253]|uniref:hypothetical protein n=1 Tax=Anabaena sp. UHCC 0253 TaxID=2590019 RepID=UPI0014483950|nr:hypothetical protein [Anabaena sp. UHCC 0253]MTJ55766.1 hypothetical protein [Anabaena sp. UHCC 0253]